MGCRQDIFTFLYIYTCRAVELQKFCEEADTEYSKILGYCKTRFLALAPAVERIITMFDVLKKYFVALPKGEKKLRDFYMEKSSKFWLMFIQEQVCIFWYFFLSTFLSFVNKV